MKKLRERRHGMLLLGVATLVVACITASPAPALAEMEGGGGGAGDYSDIEWCADGRPISNFSYTGWNGTHGEYPMSGILTHYGVECSVGGTKHRDFVVGLYTINHSESVTHGNYTVYRPAGTYYFNEYGDMQTGLVYCEDGNLRYFDPETGVMVKNKWYNEQEAVWYYFGANGTAVSGWQRIGGDWYYFYPETKDMAWGRVQIDGKYYFLDTPGADADDGRMQHKGWFYEPVYGTWSYAASSGELYTGWHKINGVWYFFGESGCMATGWFNDAGKRYYAKSSGEMATGWLKIDNTWYYLDGSGAMATGWLKIGGTWYYFYGSGSMATGWCQIGGKWYCFNASGAMLHDTWVGDYYLQSSGAMATNTWIGPYYVGADGKWVRK